MRENFDKLPKWAQSKIQALEANVKHLKEQIAQIGCQETTNVYIQDDIDRKINLPKNSHLYFIVNGRPVSVMFRGENLEIQGWQALCIYPKAENSFEFSQEEIK